MSNRDTIDDISISIRPPTEVEYLKLQAQMREMELKHQMQIREMELVSQNEKLELHHQNEKLEFHRQTDKQQMEIEKQQMQNEKQQMEIDFMKRLLHQQQLIGPAGTVDIDIEQDDIEPQLHQQDDYLNPFHPDFYSNLDSFCDSALEEHLTLNDDPSPKLLQVIVNKVIEEKECETKRIRTIVNISKMLPQQVQYVKEEIEQLMRAIQLSEEDEQSLQQSLQAVQQTHKLSRLKLQQDCQSFIKPAPLDDDPIITQFRPVIGQLELNEANIKHIDPDSGETILHNYCKYIDSTPLPVFRYLIETKGCDITIQSKYLHTPIHVAFYCFNSNEGGDINTLMYLLNLKGINVNMRDYNNYTILHSACQNINHLPIVIIKYLLEIKGCSINIQDKYLDTPIHDAFLYFNPNEGGDNNTLMYLLNLEDVDVNKKGQYGHTILHLACRRINRLPLDIINYLIETKGSKIDCIDYQGNTPFHLLMTYLSTKLDSNVSQIAEYLIQKGIPINHKNSSHLTVLDKLSQYPSTYPLTYGVLIKNGAKLGKDC
jgi:ankyrin repeat protein